MIRNNIVNKFRDLPTPFYYYDLDVLHSTCSKVKEESEKSGFSIHYAVKANANPRILEIIASYGFGADCVSYNEIERAMECGFSPSIIVFAGVGKTDLEIESALKARIACFNCESIAEIEVIDSIAARLKTKATIALRINPYIEAHTHKYITTAIAESKFGISTRELKDVLDRISSLGNIELEGIHFHVGSQITRMSVFRSLCSRVNELQEWFSSQNIDLKTINLGGGLGIDYNNPDKMPEFDEYFTLIRELVRIRPGQRIHFEPGRSIVGQCGSLITKVLYIKKGRNTTFAIVDAGMTDLIRPALYQAHHKIQNLTSNGKTGKYDVVGPICESSDTFAKYIELPETRRGDILAIRSAGAYGETMVSGYNLRKAPGVVFSDEL
ncbi:MAG TPA: diaminopimelate decarboxylase [Bacteroidales bacterium]|jgi:diaminopimelate decarboxylase|nr:diaminopimelate decarboxylase [Bacteroidales bacterium]HNY53696.1 diaminopimelate decarboxylase [Bacteroidales bacterium]HOG57621.1 diaminopimelate decarboxylase [Bacteroidales bacterium]HPX44193.1 diaminopimelate decarboxylase [Bacteroidales bacterium]HQB86830.1 diaminopimelate decarboxylase [Bacteroidales bacterium]